MRNPAVAGRFYPSSKKKIIDFIEEIDLPEITGGRIAISPHAGYPYSGKLAGKAISSLVDAETYVIIGPDHHGQGAAVALSKDTWKTPMGEVEVDTELTDKLTSAAVYDSLAHEQEHSIEVQIPFLQYYKNDFKIAPLSMGLQDEDTVMEIAEKITDITQDKDVAMVCSSDFTHYEPHETAEQKDRKAIDRILDLDLTGFYSTIRKNDISICGYGPIAIAIHIAKDKGLKGHLIEYTTSGEVTGDRMQVVGYAAITFK